MRVTDRCTVIIAAPERLAALRATASPHLGAEVIEFADTEALKALEVITLRRPSQVFVEGGFATTARGAALVKRIKADPTLTHSAVHVVTPAEVEPAAAVDDAPDKAPTDNPQHVSTVAPAVEFAPATLDRWGTRRAPRYPIGGRREIAVDGKPTRLIDLSTIGAQVISATVLKPNQRVRVAMLDANAAVRFSATVAWASFEIDPYEGARYRAGLEFLDADGAAVDAYCARHRQA